MTPSYYADLLAQHGPTYRAVDAGSEESHAIRLQILSSIVTSHNRSVLDVGCGLGHYIDYGRPILKANYLGIEVLPEMVEAAQKRRPEWRFEVGDITRPKLEWSADYVLASGLFQFEQPFVILKNMWDLCRNAVAVNFLRQAEADEWARDPADLLRLALTYTPYVTVRADYLPNDFTIVMFKERP